MLLVIHCLVDVDSLTVILGKQEQKICKYLFKKELKMLSTSLLSFSKTFCQSSLLSLSLNSLIELKSVFHIVIV